MIRREALQLILDALRASSPTKADPDHRARHNAATREVVWMLAELRDDAPHADPLRRMQVHMLNLQALADELASIAGEMEDGR